MTLINLEATDSDTNWVYYSQKGHRGTVREILQHVNLDGKFLFIIDSFNFNLRDNKNNKQPFDVYPDIFDYIQQAKQNNLKFILVFEMLMEAPSYYDLEYQIVDIYAKTGISKNDMIIWSGAIIQDTDMIRNALSTKVLNRSSMFDNNSADRVPQHHFVSLARMIRTHRIAATVEILDRNLDKYGKCSLGSGYYNTSQEILVHHIPERYADRFPMYIDGTILGSEQYNGVAPEIIDAFVNLVQETSYDANFNYLTWHQIIWHLPFITEKSIKPFIWGQVPIFISCKDHDLYLREYGYDLFDDIIDHSYNREVDPEKRIKLAIDQLENICNKPIEYWQQYKIENINRFIANRELSQIIVNTTDKSSAANLQKILDNM
jgi:hypothetical protein